MDLVADELPRGAFDFVHTRLVLIHIPERDAVLRKLAGALRPGGVLIVEEDDIHPILATATGAYRQSLARVPRAHEARGRRRRVGARAARAARRPRPRGVGAEIDGHIFPGGSATAASGA